MADVFWLSLKYIVMMSSPVEGVTPAMVDSLRTSSATSDSTDTPLTWLNVIPEVAFQQARDYTFLLHKLTH